MNTKNSSILTKRYRQILSAVHMVYRLVNSTYNVTELSLRLTRLLSQFVQASLISVYILDPKKKKIALIANFDNKINTLITKRKEIDKLSKKELHVADGYIVFEKHLMGLPLVADENIGAIMLRREKGDPAFTQFDKEMLSVIVEQSVTAIKNLQLYEDQQKVILGSIEFIGKLLERTKHAPSTTHTPVYFHIVKLLAEKINMGQEGINNLYYASILHDAGAIDVPFDILFKTSQLTADEFKVIRTHPEKSVALIKPVEFLKPILPIILYHHEKYDGTGYPSGLKKDQIPLGARVMAVVDAFESMIREKPYKHSLSIDEALIELKHNKGTQFDPDIVDAFVELSKQKKFRNFLSSIK